MGISRLYTFLFIGFLTILLSSCSVFQPLKVGKEYRTKSGIRYTVTEKGKGEKPHKGQKIKLHYIGKLSTGKEFDNSYKRQVPLVFILGAGQVLEGIDQVLLKFPAGSKGTFFLPSKLGYGDKNFKQIPPNSDLTFEFDFIEIIQPPVPFNTIGKDTIALENGLKYIMVKSEQTGIKAETYKNITVHYTGYLENGNIFDSSVERGFPFQFQLGLGQVIRGWDIGISKLKKGEKARFIIPPHLAYGEKGFPPTIPPNTSLIFDIEVLGVE